MVTGLEGTFKDYKNNWSCGSLEEWKAHLAETETTHTGKTECVTCGTNVNFKWTGKLKNGKIEDADIRDSCTRIVKTNEYYSTPKHND